MKVKPILKMSGRDIHEQHRVSTPLELLFDLTFVISFSAVGLQFSSHLSQGEIYTGLLSFAIAMFSICWAWMNYTWFASAYDTDDWIFRIATLIHMVGVIVLALGLPRFFQSVEKGAYLDNSIMVLGYVIMRLVMITLWCRAAKHDPVHRRALLANAIIIFIVQILWVILTLLKLPMQQGFLLLSVLGCIEIFGPVIFYRKLGPYPWHPHHIAERYSCLTIIALGECVAGAVAITNAIVETDGWSIEPILIGTSCVGLAFGCWWIYYLNPFGDYLNSHREKSSFWGFLHLLIFGSIVAMGAGMQATGIFLEGKSKLSIMSVTALLSISLAIFISTIFTLAYSPLNKRKVFYLFLWAASLSILALSYAMAGLNLPIPVCLGMLTIAPFVTVIGHEAVKTR